MTYNVQGHAASRNGRHLEQVAKVIREARPDIVGLQEVHCGTQRSRSLDQASILAENTGLNLHFGRSCALAGGDYGNALLTRGTLERTAVTLLPGKGEQRSLLDCTVTVDGRSLDVYVTHLTAWGRIKRKEREAQVRVLSDRISATTGPFVMMGDLNADPEALELAPLRSNERIRRCGTGKMATHRLTRAYYDHIYTGGNGWRSGSISVLKSGPSDHWPVLAELELED